MQQLPPSIRLAHVRWVWCTAPHRAHNNGSFRYGATCRNDAETNDDASTNFNSPTTNTADTNACADLRGDRSQGQMQKVDPWMQLEKHGLHYCRAR